VRQGLAQEAPTSAEREPSSPAKGGAGSSTVPHLPPHPESMIQRAISMFRAIDTSKNGSLSHEELQLYLESNPHTKETFMRRSDFNWRGLFVSMDTHADSLIDLSEFIDFYCTVLRYVIH